MQLSIPQQKRFWREWKAACLAQGWTLPKGRAAIPVGASSSGFGVHASACPAGAGMNAAELETQRHLLLERAGFQSLTEVDPLDGFDRVLSELALLTNPSDLSEQLRLANQPAIRAAYTIDQLRTEIAKLGFHNNYLRAVMADKFHTEDWASLSRAQLIQLFTTLRRRKASHARKEKQVSVPLSPACLPHCDNDPF